MHAFLLLVAIAAPPPKLAMTPFRGGDGTTAGMVEMVGESVAAEIRRKKNFQVLTYGELKTVLSHEQVNQLVGCNDAGCFANIGNAAGAEALATGKLGKVGKSWLITLKIIDVRAVRVVATADRRIRDGTIDDVLDQLPGMVSELVEGAADRLGTKEVATAAVTAVSATSSKHPIPAGWKDAPLTEETGDLQLLSDGHGHLVAFERDKRQSGRVLAGDSKGLFLQRGRSGGAEPMRNIWYLSLWDPRVRRVTLSFKNGVYLLVCGERDIPLEPVTDSVPSLFDVRWKRAPVHLARDDKGTYYYVDKASGRGNTDYRLFIGTKGRLEYHPVRDAIVDAGSSIFITDLGRLIVKKDPEEVGWAVGDSKQSLTAMSLWSQNEMIYTELGVYHGQPLGTACEPYVGSSP